MEENILDKADSSSKQSSNISSDTSPHLNFITSKDNIENSISSEDNLESLVSTESILSSINEECNKISKEKERENGMKSDSESSLDMIDKEIEKNQERELQEKKQERELQETSENGQSSLSSNTDDHTDLHDKSVDAISFSDPKTIDDPQTGDPNDMEDPQAVDPIDMEDPQTGDSNAMEDPQTGDSNAIEDPQTDDSNAMGDLPTDDSNAMGDLPTDDPNATDDSQTNASNLKDTLTISENEEETETNSRINDDKETSAMETDINDELIKESLASDLESVNENDTDQDHVMTDPISAPENDTAQENLQSNSGKEKVMEINDLPPADEHSPPEKEKMVENNEDETSEKNGSSKIKIKLRSFASLCENDKPKEDDMKAIKTSSSTDFEVSGVAVGDIVQHSNIVESDESGVMHLKISNVVGGEDCITGLSLDDGGDSLFPIQISSITSLIEPLSPDEVRIEKIMSSNSVQSGINSIQIAEVESMAGKVPSQSESDIPNNKENVGTGNENAFEVVVNIFRSPLVVTSSCMQCKKKSVCEFRLVSRHNSENKVSFICSSKCKTNAISNLPESQIIQKPRLYFERVCGMCGNDISSVPKENILSWQTREFCNKLCLADHIGEVGRTCFYCKSNVRVLYMVKYCVRFGSDVHQFCCNTCLETYKTTIKVCSFCQKNLSLINKVISPSNKEYCSNKCLKRAQRRDIGQINYKEENECTVCLKKMVNIYEFIHNGAPTFLCSNPCLNVFKYVNQVKSVNCCLCARLLNAEDTSNYFFNGKQLRVFCSESCFSVFVISARKIVTCYYCKVKKYNFDMISATLSEEFGECFCCSVCCLNFLESQCKNSSGQIGSVTEKDTSVSSKNELPALVSTGSSNDSSAGAPSAPILKNCNMCAKLEPAQFHMVMSDSTLRSFCSYVCAARYKCTFGFQVSGGIQTINKEEVDGQIKESQSTETQTNIPPGSVTAGKIKPKVDLKDTKTMMRLFCPPHMMNKSTLCRPLQSTKGIQCKPHQWHKSTQTEECRALIPVPIPVYVPTPMMMYSAPTPVPLVIPVPVPIPIFIPTGEKTTKDLEDRIKTILESGPSVSSPAAKEEESSTLKRKFNEDEGEDAENLDADLSETEIEVISKMEATLPKYDLKTSGESSEGRRENETIKRKSDSDDVTSCKRRKVNDDAEEETEEYLDLLLGLSVWHAWVQRKSNDDTEESQLLQEDLSNMTSEDLSHCLILFLDELSAQSSQFEADTIFYILLGLQKYLFEKGSTHCIFLEVNFDKFTSTFDEMVQRFYQTTVNPETKFLEGTRVTEEMLWEARQLGAHTPHVLINTLFYFNTKIFKLKNPTDHLNLCFNSILKEGKRMSNNEEESVLTTYLKYSQEVQQEGKDASVTDLLMLENKDNPLRCPVKLYEFYLSKCPASIRTRKDTYYVYPERTCLPDCPVWYSEDPLEVNTITKMLNRILLVREVQESLLDI